MELGAGEVGHAAGLVAVGIDGDDDYGGADDREDGLDHFFSSNVCRAVRQIASSGVLNPSDSSWYIPPFSPR